MSICLIGQQGVLFPLPGPLYFLLLLVSRSLNENILGSLEGADNLLELAQSEISEKEVFRSYLGMRSTRWFGRENSVLE